MALLTTYTDANKIIQSGKTQRITCSAPSEPLVTLAKGTDGNYTATSEAWYEMTCVSSASFAYVGMTYAAASACRAAMIRKFTRTKTVWEYKATVAEDGTASLGWVQSSTGATVQEAEIDLTPMGGHMYQVSVIVNCTDVKYTTKPSTVTFAYPACMSDVD